MALLLTGGAGFIGSTLLDQLLAQDSWGQIVVVDSFNDAYSPAIKRRNIAHHAGNPRLELVEADFADADVMRPLFARCKFDYVVHLGARAGVRASLQNPMEFERSNGQATTLILELARQHKCRRVVMASSSSVYGNTNTVPFTEADPCLQCVSPYAATKRANEIMAWTFWHLYKMPISCLRFFTVYGPRQRPDMGIHIFTRSILRGQPVNMFGDGSMSRDFTYVNDIVSGIIATITADTGYEIFNLGNTQTIRLRELIDVVAEACGQPAKINQLPMQSGDVDRTWADISKAKKLLGYQPKTDIRTGVKNFVAWYRENEAFLQQA
jgi:UDP-glucuronate 4-epimerase